MPQLTIIQRTKVVEFWHLPCTSKVSCAVPALMC